MKKMTAITAAIALTLGASIVSAPAQAAGSQEAQGVSAHYRVDLGYMVGWERISNRSGVTGFTVTASNGKTCTARGSAATKCVFPARTLGYTGSFNFTVTTNGRSGVLATSEVSNTVGAASIPNAPLAIAAQAVSNDQIDVTWIPSSGTGNLSVYGYEVTYWKSNSVGGPDSSTKTSFVATETYASFTAEPDTLYIVSVATCNALGCNSVDSWAYATTTPDAEAVTSIELPRTISGGRADTTCFESIYDAQNGETLQGSCGPVVADPSTYPVVDPTATEVGDPVLATKFKDSVRLSRFLRSYSLRTWGPIGISWFANFTATSKSYTQGFTSTPHIESRTPDICEIVDTKIVLKSTGYCTVAAYTEGNNTFERSNTAVTRIRVTN